MTTVNLIYHTEHDKIKNDIKLKLDELYKDKDIKYSLSDNSGTNFADCHLGRYVDAPYRYFYGHDWIIVDSPIHLFLIQRYFYHKLKHYDTENNIGEFLSFYATNEKLFGEKLKCSKDESIVINESLKLTKLIYNDNLPLTIIVNKMKQYDEFICNEGEDGYIMESSYREALNELGLVLTDKELF